MDSTQDIIQRTANMRSLLHWLKNITSTALTLLSLGFPANKSHNISTAS